LRAGSSERIGDVERSESQTLGELKDLIVEVRALRTKLDEHQT
jgi:hypothetical protein